MPEMLSTGRRPAALWLAPALALLTACGGSEDTASDGSVSTTVQADTRRLIVQLHPAALAPTATTTDARALQAEPLQRRTEAAVQGLSQRLLARHGLRAGHHFTRAIQGFSVEVPAARAEALRQQLEDDPAVLAVRPDAPVSAGQSMSVRTLTTAGHWGLDRIDQRKPPLDQRIGTATRGQGVTVFVVDSGISPHDQFGGRLAGGIDVVGDGRGSADCSGHGTHVAGTIGGSVAGVAPEATLMSVRVLDCNGSGSIQGVMSGLDWVLSRPERPAVVNMSLGAGAHDLLDESVQTLLRAGIHVAVSAGNENADACLRSPARVPGALTVGASDSADRRASFSNVGRCVDLLAPGQQILAPDWRSTSAERVLSGTSMASPHVAGTMALLLQSRPGLTPPQLAQQLIAQATSSVLTQLSGSPNRLLFAGSAPAVPFPATHAVHIDLLQGDTVVSRGHWIARASVRVRNAFGQPVAGVLVNGLYQGARLPVTCTTAPTGLCTLSSTPQTAAIAELALAVRWLEGPTVAYRREFDRARTLSVRRPSTLAPR